MAQNLPLARIRPAQALSSQALNAQFLAAGASAGRGAAPGGSGSSLSRRGGALTPREKAAVVVRWLLDQGADLPIAQLPDQAQSHLAEQMGQMRLVDRNTLDMVMQEFTAALEEAGIAFPGGLEGALSVMDGHLSQAISTRLRRKVGVGQRGDPWERLGQLPAERLLPVLEGEAAEIAAVVLSKLPVQRAADFLSQLPADAARRIAYAVSRTADTEPDMVHRIGLAVLAQVENQPGRAFERDPVERVGAILNLSSAATREEILRGLADEDTGFAEDVRRSIFTFAQFPQRIAGRDIPKIVRLIDQASLVTAFAYCRGKPGLEEAAEFILACISQRLAQTLREEAAGLSRVKERDGEASTAQFVLIARQLEAQGELVLLRDEDHD